MGAKAAIAGLGITDMGKVFGRTVSDFAGDAIALALEDAGLQARDLDGLLINGNQSEEMAPSLQFALGLVDLTLLNTMSAFGSSAATMLQYAAHAIESGQANVVACVYADAPLTAGESISQSGYSGKRFNAPGLAGLRFAYGDYGPANSMYALALRRHMHLFGTNHDHLGTIAVGQREWALMNPRAQMKKPMTLDGLPRLPVGRGAPAPVRLLRGVQRRDRGDRHLARSGRGTCASRRCTSAVSGSAPRVIRRGPSATRRSIRAPGSLGSSRWRRRGSGSQT